MFSSADQESAYSIDPELPYAEISLFSEQTVLCGYSMTDSISRDKNKSDSQYHEYESVGVFSQPEGIYSKRRVRLIILKTELILQPPMVVL